MLDVNSSNQSIVSLHTQLQTSRYLYIAILTVYVLEIFYHTCDDYKIVCQGGFKLIKPTYAISRLSCFLYVLTNVIFQTSPVGHCRQMQKMVQTFYVITVSSTSLLFIFRIRAVFGGRKIIVSAFLAMWVLVVGASTLAPIAISGKNIANTAYCVNSEVKRYSSIAIIVFIINDTIILLTLCRQLQYGPPVDEEKWCLGKLCISCIGETYPLAKKLLRGNQSFFLVAVIGNVITVAVILSSSSSAIHRAMFTVPNIALCNIMACKIFRDVHKAFREQPPKVLVSRSATICAKQPTLEDGRYMRCKPLFADHEDQDPNYSILEGIETRRIQAFPNSELDTDDRDFDGGWTY